MTEPTARPVRKSIQQSEPYRELAEGQMEHGTGGSCHVYKTRCSSGHMNGLEEKRTLTDLADASPWIPEVSS